MLLVKLPCIIRLNSQKRKFKLIHSGCIFDLHADERCNCRFAQIYFRIGQRKSVETASFACYFGWVMKSANLVQARKG